MNQAFYVSLAEWSQVAASLLFIAILVFIWTRFISPGIVRSQERKNAELADAERRRDAAKADIETAHSETSTTDDEISAITARAESDAQHLHDRMLAGATAEGRRLVGNAEGELERGRYAARARLREELVAKALDIARGAATYINEGTNRRLIDEAVASVDRQKTV
jgi:F0F1-type ATP synthase membrane subunit b/b'